MLNFKYKYHKSNCVDCNEPCNGIRCRPCNTIMRRNAKNYGLSSRKHHLLKKYNMTVDEFEAWWIVFRGKCGICDIDLVRPQKSRGQPMNSVCVDHDHASGKIRGLLCAGCNKGLGMFRDNKKSLKRALEWIGDNNGT